MSYGKKATVNVNDIYYVEVRKHMTFSISEIGSERSGTPISYRCSFRPHVQYSSFSDACLYAQIFLPREAEVIRYMKVTISNNQTKWFIHYILQGVHI